jgi:hypothetical protein
MNEEFIAQLMDRPIAFQRSFIALNVGVTGALMLSQAWEWTNRSDDKDGWFFKTQVEWEEIIGLTRYEQETARRRLKELGVLLEKRRGLPAQLCYRVDTSRLKILLCELFDCDENAEGGAS